MTSVTMNVYLVIVDKVIIPLNIKKAIRLERIAFLF